MKRRTGRAVLSLNRPRYLLVLVAATAVACSSSTSEATKPTSSVAPTTLAIDEPAIATLVVPKDSFDSPVTVTLAVSGLEPLGDGAAYVLVSYDGDKWIDGGAFGIDGTAVVMAEGTTELVIRPELPHVAILVRSDDEKSQFDEAYWVADGSIDGTSTIQLVDVSGRDRIEAYLELAS